METPRPLCYTIFCHLAELLSVEGHTWEMVAMVFLTEVSLMVPLQAPSEAQFSHAHHCGRSWGGGWAPAGTMEEQASNQCGVVWGTGPLCNPCHLRLDLVLSRHPCPELMVRAITAPRHLPLHVFQMLGCTNLSEDVDRALEIFPMYLQSQCLGMPSLVLRAILKLTKRPSTVSRGQLGQPGQQPSSGLVFSGHQELSWLLAALTPPQPSAPCKERGSSANGNRLPLSGCPSRNASSRATSLSISVSRDWPWGAEPQGETQQTWWGLLTAQAAFQAVLVAHQPAQGGWWRRGQTRGWKRALSSHSAPCSSHGYAGEPCL